MTDTTEIADALTGEQALALVRTDPASVILDEKRWERFFAAIQEDLRKEPSDLSTEKGRKAVASKAYKVTQTKTAIDTAAKKMKSRINDRQKEIYDTLDRLAIETRAPLTAWEEHEKSRLAKCKEITDRILRMSQIAWDDTSDGVINRLCEIEMLELDPKVFLDDLEQAQETLRQAVETMNAAIERLEKEEADKAELKRLRDLEAKRVADEAAEAKRVADEAQRRQNTGEQRQIAAAELVNPGSMAPVADEASAGAVGEGTVQVVSLADVFEAAGMPADVADRMADTLVEDARQSPVNEAVSALDETPTARNESIFGLMNALLIDTHSATAILDAIIAGDIPHVTFNA